MRTFSGTIAAGVAALVLAGCATATAADRPEPASDLTADLTQTIENVGYQVFHAAAGEDKNTVVSPVSIGLAFGMADAGASGSVAGALAQWFSFPGTGESRLAAFNAYEQALTIAPGTKGEDPDTGEEVTLPTITIANRVFTDTRFEPRDEYVDMLETWFGAGAESVPMRDDPSTAADAINSWVDERTEGLIQDLYNTDSFDDDSRLALINALYMKATWKEELDPNFTFDEPFTLLDGSAVTVSMMLATDTATRAARGDGYVAASLAYAGETLEMVVFVPDTGRFDDVRARLGADLLGDFDAAEDGTNITVRIPKFEAGSKLDLRALMEEDLGWEGIFGVVGMDGIGDDLLIASATHATKVIVDEKGTEAAAVTSIDVEDGSMPEPGLDVIADQPFLYVIRDVDTGASIFVGQVLDPSL